MNELRGYGLLALPAGRLDETGVLCNSVKGALPAVYHPTDIAYYALAHWNAYITTDGDEHKEIFMAQAHWLLAHETRFSNNAGGWPVSFSSSAQHLSRPCLSALTQGSAVSVLVRAYRLTGKDAFLQSAHRAMHTFELDILDGGVSASIGDDGVFFEEVAVYPAAHILNAHILALFGLYDYVALTCDSETDALIQRSINTLHMMLDEFDTGYWTRYDLLHKRLASWYYHSLHISSLEALARYSHCDHCATLAASWAKYQLHPGQRLRYLFTSRAAAYYDSMLKPVLRRHIYRITGINEEVSHERVCIPITAFPVAGGMRGVLAGVAQVMSDQWEISYLTHYKGRGAEGLEIETFGGKGASPWQFPFVWLYCLAGWRKLCALLRQGKGYNLILPQDGVFTGAFAALVGKMLGVRVVCMDHGNVTLLDSPSFRKERIKYLKAYPWYLQLLARLQLAFYWPSQHLLACIATRYTDQFLIAGDEVEDVYRKRLGVHSSRIVRYAYMLDVTCFTPPEKESRVKMRAKQDIAEDAIVITLINRLALEKGLHVAIEGIAHALSTLPTEIRVRVRVLIAGDGPLRSEVQADISERSLDSVCRLLGEATPSDVVTLLAISDIFLYSGTRGTNYSMAVLEAMAAGCAVIASMVPQSNVRLLAEGRGIGVEPGNARVIADALVRLCSDLELCRQMGQMSREYVSQVHNAQMLKRSLLRVSFFAPSIVVEDAESS